MQVPMSDAMGISHQVLHGRQTGDKQNTDVIELITTIHATLYVKEREWFT